MLMAGPRSADAERLKGHECSRVTVGEHRVIFDVRDGLLRVVAIGKRNDDEVDRRGRSPAGGLRAGPGGVTAASIHGGDVLPSCRAESRL